MAVRLAGGGGGSESMAADCDSATEAAGGQIEG